MDCGSCRAENRSTRRFCWQCGSPLAVVRCEQCDYDNWPGERFCGGCGAALAGDDADRRVGAERRQLTVMFVDLVGSTALSGRLDAEELRELIVAFQDACAARIARYQGYIARYMGDGLLVYFGYPRAHEDDAERAVRAGLEIVEAVQALAHPARPAVRVGIATGRVVAGDLIGEGASEERAVIGETPNLAARLQGLARPDTVVVSASTRRLLPDAFELTDLGAHPLRGFDDPVQAWCVEAVRVVPSRFAARRRGDLAPLVGRDAELELLTARWRAARDGQGQAVAIVGPAGAGKSRLLVAFDRHLRDEATCLRMQCSPHQGSTAFHPLIHYATRAAEVGLDDPGATRRDKITRWARSWSDHDDDVAALLGLFSLDDGPIDADPTAQRRAVLAFFARGITHLLASSPLVVAVEDLQWADPSTRELVAGLVERSHDAPMMVLLTHRPELSPLAGVTPLVLDRLSPRAAADLVRAIAGDGLEDHLVETIVRRADGVPAFVEELTRAVLDGDGDAVPETLTDSLMAQLDRLPGARPVAQAAAVIGREFSPELLEHVFDGAPTTLQRGLQELVESGLVRAPGLDPGAPHAFRHALLRDVAYDSLLHRDQRATHARTAAALIEAFSSTAEADPALVAHHLEQGGDGAAAARWLRRAAAQAWRQGGHAERIAHLERARALAATPEDRVEVRTDLALAYRNRERYAEAFAVLDEALAIGEAVGLLEPLARDHYALGNLHFLQADLAACWAAHQRSLELARQAGSARAEARALGGLGDAAFGQGDIATATRYLTECVDRARQEGFDAIAAANQPITAMCSVWSLDAAQGLRLALEAQELAWEVGHRRAGAIAANAACVALVELERTDEWLAQVQRLESIGTSVGDLGRALGLMHGARVHRRVGDLQQARAAIAEAQAVNASLESQRFVGLLAAIDASVTDGFDDWDALYAALEQSPSAFPALGGGGDAIELALAAGRPDQAVRYAEQMVRKLGGPRRAAYADLFLDLARAVHAGDARAPLRSRAQRGGMARMVRILDDTTGPPP